MLEMTPCLEELILLLPRHAVFDRSQATPVPPSPSARLSFPNVRKFALHAETVPPQDENGKFYHFVQAAWLLSAVNLPHDTIYSLSGHTPSDAAASYYGSRAMVPLPLPSDYDVSHILIRADVCDSIMSKRFPATFIGSSGSPSGSHVRFCTDHDIQRQMAHFYDNYLRGLATAFVNSVTIPQDGLELWIQTLPLKQPREYAQARSPEPYWVADVFSNTTTLVVLCSPFWYADTFFRTLLPRKHRPDDMPFPLLRTLRLHLDLLDVPGQLSSTLARRQTTGYSLDKLVVEYTLPTGDSVGVEKCIRAKTSYLKEWVAELRQTLVCEVEVREVEGPPAMQLPASCNTDCSEYWPPWTFTKAQDICEFDFDIYV
ncbi:hypothetical protein C8Q76DRAFT_855996 [Earliella scabrosa]|nr:hypothetical protein C8Q76DRAFT_855996 [Earliella scabrosa]